MPAIIDRLSLQAVEHVSRNSKRAYENLSMTSVLSEIQWHQPIVPVHRDPEWEGEVKRKVGSVMDVMRRVAPSPWLRTLTLEIGKPRLVHVSGDLATMVMMVCAQENACRYCYGAMRATMRILGFSEKRISLIERGLQMAELNERERVMLNFTRKLARSNPRPGRAELELLLQAGYSKQAVAEAAYYIAFGCFFNRVATFVASPPEMGLERIANGWLGRILAPLLASRMRLKPASLVAAEPEPGHFAVLSRPLMGLPAASVVRGAIAGAFSSPALSPRLRLLMIGVVGRALQCPHCEAQCRDLVGEMGLNAEEFDSTMRSLTNANLSENEQRILAWTRDTVRYQTEHIQRSTRQLGDAIGVDLLLEAIGMASLANAMVRLAVILE